MKSCCNNACCPNATGATGSTGGTGNTGGTGSTGATGAPAVTPSILSVYTDTVVSIPNGSAIVFDKIQRAPSNPLALAYNASTGAVTFLEPGTYEVIASVNVLHSAPIITAVRALLSGVPIVAGTLTVIETSTDQGTSEVTITFQVDVAPGNTLVFQNFGLTALPLASVPSDRTGAYMTLKRLL
jgi:hypothetical protein